LLLNTATSRARSIIHRGAAAYARSSCSSRNISSSGDRDHLELVRRRGARYPPNGSADDGPAVDSPDDHQGDVLGRPAHERAGPEGRQRPQPGPSDRGAGVTRRRLLDRRRPGGPRGDPRTGEACSRRPVRGGRVRRLRHAPRAPPPGGGRLPVGRISPHVQADRERPLSRGGPRADAAGGRR